LLLRRNQSSEEEDDNTVNVDKEDSDPATTVEAEEEEELSLASLERDCCQHSSATGSALQMMVGDGAVLVAVSSEGGYSCSHR
jgi:hypothetical protein